MPKVFHLCPVCESLVDIRNDHVYCKNCGEIFIYSKEYKVWENPKILDISYIDPRSTVLSTMFPHSFSLDTIYGKKTFNSFEAFLLTLCWPGTDVGIYDELARLSRIDAHRVQLGLFNEWKKSQKVTWNKRKISRDSEEYHALLRMAFDKLFEQSHLFRMGLISSGNKILLHSAGEDDHRKTLLTREEYISNLNRQRDKLKM